jgi:uncharacterized protein (TIGR02001 family)
MIMRTAIKSLAIGLVAASSIATAALADGMDKKASLKDSAPADGRQFAWSVNMGATTDYVFRGFSQSKSEAAVSAGADFTYGILYAGLWASTVDFGKGTSPSTGMVNAELDLYAGIKPTWGPLTFDLGVIYYTYPGAEEKKTGQFELDYVELKAGVSGNIGKLALGGTVFYSPEYQNKQGEVWTLEGTAGYELPKVWIFTPTVGGTLGYQIGNSSLQYRTVTGNGDDNYMYWNAGVALAADKFAVDLRYWDTNISNSGLTPGFCTGKVLSCDERFVASVKFTLP